MRNFACFIAKKRPALVIIFLLILQAVYGTVVFPEENDLKLQGDCKIVLTKMTSHYRYIVKDWQTTFSLKIENKGNTPENIVLGIKNNNLNCKNPDDSSNSGNVELNPSLEDAATNLPIENLTLQPGESHIFTVRVKVPQQIALHAWNCAEVTATPADCPSSFASFKLYSYVDSPDAE